MHRIYVRRANVNYIAIIVECVIKFLYVLADVMGLLNYSYQVCVQ